MNIHKVTNSPIVKPRDLIMISKVTLPKYDVTKRSTTNARFYKNIRYERVIFYHLSQLPMI